MVQYFCKDKRKGRAKTKQTVGGQSSILKPNKQTTNKTTKQTTTKKVHKRLAFLFLVRYNIIKDKEKDGLKQNKRSAVNLQS